MSYQRVLVSWLCNWVNLTWLWCYMSARLHNSFHKTWVSKELKEAEYSLKLSDFSCSRSHSSKKISVLSLPSVSFHKLITALQFFASSVLINQVDLWPVNITGPWTLMKVHWLSPVSSYDVKQKHSCARNPVCMWPPTALLSLGSAILFSADRSAVANTCPLDNCCHTSELSTLVYNL